MRKKEFRKITGLVMVIALFACIFTYRIYAEEPATGSQTNEGQVQEGETPSGETNTNPTDQNNNEEKKEEETRSGTVTDPTDKKEEDIVVEEGKDPEKEQAKDETPESDKKEEEEDGAKKAEAKNGGEDNSSNSSQEVGDFVVTGNENNYEFDETNGILKIKGDVKVKNKESVPVTAQSIIISDSCTVTLEGIHIDRSLAEDDNCPYPKGQGILIEALNNTNSQNVVTLDLADGTVNDVKGSKGKNINATTGSWAGIEVEFLYEDSIEPKNEMASLIISGNGTLNVEGSENAAAIGGSNSSGGSKGYGLYGNITIQSGTVNAKATGGGAGIGSSNNPGGGTSHGSYKATGNNTWGTITINGGNVTAIGGSGAGIGGGNHVDSGKIIINGGTIDAKGQAGIGCGVGSSKNKGNGGDKGPGYYWADVEINGGDITARATWTDNWGGAGIGGGGYCDAVVKITGGTIHAYGGSCGSDHNALHHGGAGIGGGYEGHAEVTISGGTIYAYAGYSTAAGIGSGGTPNSNPDRGNTGRGTTKDLTKLTETTVTISNGDVHAYGYPEDYDSSVAIGSRGGAGIGGGTGADKIKVIITGGTIEAWGSPSNREEMQGGAGIGSGLYAPNLTIPGTNNKENAKYQVETDVDVTITGGNVLAVGGWGAAGIGSGAKNKMANTITLDNTKADIVAYADGTKFAIDTRDLDLTTNITTSHRDGRNIEGYILQGTFVHNYTPKDEQGNALVDEQDQVMNQATEGLNDIKIIDDMTGARERNLTGMPEGYRSFAATVSKAGKYNVYTDSAAISNGGGRYFAEYYKDVIDESYWSSRIDQNRFVQYEAKDHELCDNFYLYPVKSIVVDKVVKLEGDAKAEDIDLTTYFAIREKRYVKDENGISVKDESDDAYIKVKDKDGNLVKWIQSIEIVDGVPQNKVYFTNVEDKTYEVLEVDKDGNVLNAGTAYGTTILKKIETRHGDAEDNDGVISKEVWTDRVTVINFYTKDSKVDVLIRKILPTEYKFENYKDTTVIFKVEVKDSEENVTYESYVGITLSGEEASFNKDLGKYVYERRLKDIPISSSDTLSVTEVYSSGYQLADNAVSITQPNSETNYYLVEALNNVDEYIPGSGAVNSYHNKTHVSKLAVEGGE